MNMRLDRGASSRTEGGLSGSRRQYALRYGGGILLMGIGLGIVAAGKLGTAWVFPGLAVGAFLGIVGTVAAHRRIVARFGHPTRHQFLSLAGAVAVEMIAFYMIGALGLLHGIPDQSAWRIVLLVVAAHFLLMYWSMGPWLFWLGTVNLIWVALSAVLTLPLSTTFIGDGIVKAAVGVIMALPVLRAASAKGTGSVLSE